MRLKDKVAIVTGAARGMGRGFALSLAGEGANIVAVDIKMEELARTEALVKEKGREIITMKVDVSCEEDTLSMAEMAASKFGRIDILVNNAAIFFGMKPKPFNEYKLEEWEKHINVTVLGQWLCAKAVFPYLKKQNKGKIINIASSVFFRPLVGYMPYTVCKTAIIGLNRLLAAELGQYNINVNAIAPGSISTEALYTLMSEDDAEQRSKAGLIKRVGQISDVSGMVVFLASDDSDFITGQTMVIDGGRVMH
jgi:NAD(P)-dependent dehydrogenase (short-subunit alcohol dehydrogenase family)